MVGLMTETWRVTDWSASLLMLPVMGLVLMGLVDACYKLHVRKAAATEVPSADLGSSCLSGCFSKPQRVV